MTLATEERTLEVGTAVTLKNGVKGRIEGVGEVYRGSDDDPSETVTVYEIEITETTLTAGDKAVFEGERMLLYRGAFTVAEEFDVKVRYEFSARVKGDDEVQATEAFITALVDALTFDGDDDAPEPLVELQMRRVG